MASAGIKRDDEVMVVSGKDRGRTGRVVRVLPREGRIMVEGVARHKKHSRTGGKKASSGRQLQQGGIIDVDLYVDISNVQIVCKSCGQPTRIGYRIDEEGKTRICRKCEADL